MITYYSEFNSIKDIHNPLLGNSTYMRYSGSFENNEDQNYKKFLRKTLHNQGRIYNLNSSNLFTINSGYVGMEIRFSNDIKNGVLYENNDYVLWGVNLSKVDIESSGIGVFFTNNGIEFKVETSAGKYSLIDNQTTILANQRFLIEFFWNKDGLDITEDPTMVIRVNGDNIIGGVIPIVDDSVVNSSFYTAISQSAPSTTNVFLNKQFQVLDNVFNFHNTPCDIFNLKTGYSMF